MRSTPDSGVSISAAQIRHVVDMLRHLGEPLPTAESARVLGLLEGLSDERAAELGRLLDEYTLIRVRLDRHGIGHAAPGGANPQLTELGWRTFLMRVENPARLTGPMILVSRSAIPEGELRPGIHDSQVFGNDVPQVLSSVPDADTDYDAGNGLAQWMGYCFGSGMRLTSGLEGMHLEYLLLQVYSQVGGVNTAALTACSAAAPPGRRAECKGYSTEFFSIPASTVTLTIQDGDGEGTMASLVIRDQAGRLYPAPAHRLEPDLGYQEQVYRADGETVRLPAGQYQIIAQRGPEYLASRQDLVSPSGGETASLAIRLRRWIDPARLGWYPGDPHLHPEGQAFGVLSKLGLTPETMLRQVRGEALSIGSVLIWAGGYYYEKQFLTGHVYQPTYRLPFPDAQRINNTALTPRPAPHDTDSIVRYDVEQAAFPTNRLGHLMLLCLQNHDYPGAKSIFDWPSWNMPILRWAREQGAVVGYAHVGHAMDVNSDELPNYEIPPLDGLGANECLVDVTHGLVDFIAAMELHPVMELNLWYHILNCGFPVPMAGETDFVGSRPRAGTGRTYVRLDSPPVGDQGYSAWVAGLRSGRLYFGDGRSHLMDFRADGHPSGDGPLALPKASQVTVSAQVAAWLDDTPTDPDHGQSGGNPWHIERARVGSSRTVPLDVVVNGQAVQQLEVVADGTIRTMTTKIDIPRSSWVALRILPSAHTAPIFITVAGQPVRASRRSAQWCLECIEVLWEKHARRIRESERPAAAAAWDYARATYRKIISECPAVDTRPV